MTMIAKFLHLSATLAMVLTFLPVGAHAQARVPAIVAVCAPCHRADGSGADIENQTSPVSTVSYLRQQLLAFRSGKRKHPDMSKPAET